MSRFSRRGLFLMIVVLLGLVAALPQATKAAPAPPLNYLQVLAVASANSPSWEYVSASQFSTVVDHGGSWLYIATEEYGYGQSRIAKFNGVTVAEYDNDPITDAGGTIVGWIRYWYITGNITGGQFTYQSTSINYPWNTMSDSLYIK